jgi:hypothetical protein
VRCRVIKIFISPWFSFRHPLPYIWSVLCNHTPEALYYLTVPSTLSFNKRRADTEHIDYKTLASVENITRNKSTKPSCLACDSSMSYQAVIPCPKASLSDNQLQSCCLNTGGIGASFDVSAGLPICSTVAGSSYQACAALLSGQNTCVCVDTPTYPGTLFQEFGTCGTACVADHPICHGTVGGAGCRTINMNRGYMSIAMLTLALLCL